MKHEINKKPFNLFNTQHTALITGASSGIGRAFAHTLAEQGVGLILVARRTEKLKALAQELQERHHTRCTIIPMDLTTINATHILSRQIEAAGLSVDILINNAGFSTYGNFGDIPLAEEQQLLHLNILALTELCHAFMPSMAHRGFGAVINLCSTTSFFPLPLQATYAASKAYVLSLSEALWYEYRPKGVRVIGICPGATDTEFFDVLGQNFKGTKAAPQDVVHTALQGLADNKPSVVHGLSNAIQAHLLPRALTRKSLIRLVGKISGNVYLKTEKND